MYDIIPAELNKQNKKFVFSMLDKELKFMNGHSKIRNKAIANVFSQIGLIEVWE